MKTDTSNSLISAGIIAGPLFILTALIQAFTREGFDIVSHPASSLSNGDLGWIQILNFSLSGLLVVIFAIGVKQIWKAGRWTSILTGIFGAALIIGGIFSADEGFGFPPGVPEGFPEVMSLSGTIHSFAPMIGFIALILAFFGYARYFASTRQRGWMIATLTINFVVIILFVMFNAAFDPESSNFNFLALWAAIITGFGWLSVIATKLKKQFPHESR